MKKAYSLDFEITLATDRNQHVINILDNLETNPNQDDLEQRADYILFGKDEKYLSARDRREITQPDRRYNSWKGRDEKNESLDALMEDPVAAPEIENRIHNDGPRYKVVKPVINRPKYDKDGNLIDPGDSDIPGMVELWERIDVLQERYDMYRGKIPPNDYVRNHPLSGYNLYKFGHQLIDIRRHQYYLKDAYKPAIHFFNVPSPGKVEPFLDANTGLWLTPEEWCYRKRNPKPFDLPQPALEDAPEREDGKLYWKISDSHVDYENPDHIGAILDNYVNLLKHSYDAPNNSTSCMLFDIERFVNESDLTELEYFLLTQRVAHRNLFVIQNALSEEKIYMSDASVRTLMKNKIPQKLAATATRLRLESDAKWGRIELLECSKCHQKLPKHPFYYSRSRDKRTGYCSQCKACQKATRDSKEATK